MIYLVSDKNSMILQIKNKDWEILWEFIQFLNKNLVFPIFTERDFIGIGLYQNNFIDLTKTNQIYNLLKKSFDDGTFQNYIETYYRFPSEIFLNFHSFCNLSEGFYIKTKLS